MGHFPTTRLRRLRSNETIRRMVRETHLSMDDCVLPLFINETLHEKKPITSMPGHFQLSLKDIVEETKSLQALGIQSVMLFGIPKEKDPLGSSACHAEGVIQRATQIMKDVAPDMLVMADLCFCEYTSHGHCGYIAEDDSKQGVDNDRTLELLTNQALSLVQAGVDILAPSAMMDGQVKGIRQVLDQFGYSHVGILAHAAKYSSCMYGPFKEAAEGAPQFGDRKTYQMDPANGLEALREVTLDLKEGADIVMVKPAHTYLDVIHNIKQHFKGVPVAAYHVSGEFAMIKAAAEKGWLDEKQAVLEVLTSIKRAGADIIVNYFTKDLAKYLA